MSQIETTVQTRAVDAQLHTWLQKDHPVYRWDPTAPQGFFETELDPDPIESVVAAMDRVGVGAGILVVPRHYGWDNSYALDSARRYPARFRVVGRIDPIAPDPRRRLAELMADPMMIGIRLSSKTAVNDWARDGAFEPMLAAAEELEVVWSGAPGPAALDRWTEVARRHPDLRLLVDHLGLEPVPHTMATPGPEPFRFLPDLLALSDCPNVHVKLTGAPALSVERYPFRDIWGPVTQIVAAFGADRVLWGSDCQRTQTLHSYEEGAGYLAEIDGLTAETKRKIYGDTLRRVFEWPEEPPQSGPVGAAASG
jgi:L-fuconolactonase